MARRAATATARARALERERLRELLDRLYRAAWAMCGSRYDAEDLVQETVTRVLARPRILRGGDEFPYLMRALRNTYLTGLRTAARRPRTTELPADGSLLMESSHAVPDIVLERRATFDAIADLPEDFRAALVAVDILGLSYRAAAGVLHTSEATIATRLFRARQGVARALSGEHA